MDLRVEEALMRLHAAAREHWAELPELPLDDFIAHVATAIPPGHDAVVYLESLVIEDLYLACACMHDVPGAIAAFDARWLSAVPGYVARIDRSRDLADEICQQVRERMLVRRPDRPPKIAEYSGRGSLASWLRVVAVRLALDHRARPDEVRRTDDSDLMLERLADETAPDQLILQARWAGAMTAALRRAVATLVPEQRVILRMYFASGQNTQQIARMLRVDRSTAARRLVAARQAIFEATHRFLSAELPIDTVEFASLARALHDQLDVSLSGLLGAGASQA
jgi:RNA polymerase sigma-70 factor (ECF subfamily)